MDYHAPSRCPVCGETMSLTRLHCSHCDTELTGSFTPCRFCTLEQKHMDFIEAFLKSRGSIKEVEKMLGASYPTVRNMMDAALTALGWNQPVEQTYSGKIIAELSGGKIDVTEAIKKLSEEK